MMMNVMHDFGGLNSPGFGPSPGFFQDAELGSTAALTELEKGLRSPKFGEQCRAIVKFPRLFEKYPFPVLINTALLKLAEVFRTGPNFIKLCILRVCDGSQRHLDKMTSVDELVRRIVTVMNSNDPVARALTLRTFGSLAGILCNKKQVHQKVRTSLDSNDTVELEAAIYAAERFAAGSKTFSTDICSKLLEMIKGFATPLSVKLKMIPIFEHMHHDGPTASTARTNCLELLESYPGQDFVITILQTLTALSIHTLIHIPQQVTLLLEYLATDPRSQVQDEVLNDLKVLAEERTAHLWTKENIENLVEYIKNNSGKKDKLCIMALNVLIQIVEAGGVYKLDLAPSSSIIKLLQTLSYSGDLALSASSTHLLTQIAVSVSREGLEEETSLDILGEAVQAIESLCLLVSGGNSYNQQEMYYLKKAFKCLILLCATKPDSTGQFVDILGGMMMSKYEDTNSILAITETLAALGDNNQGVLSLLLNDICNLLMILTQEDMSCSSIVNDSSQTNRVIVLLLTMLIQTMCGHKWSSHAQQVFRSGTEVLDAWSQYKLARTALRYGEHGVAVQIFSNISNKVHTDLFYNWIHSLELFASAEQLLSRDESRKSLHERMNVSMKTLHQGLTTLRAASSPNRQLTFQIQFIRCRIRYVESLYQLVSAATSLQTSPPPAIAAAFAAQSRDDLQRCGRVTGQLRNAVKELQECAGEWGKLAEASFDADLASLAFIRILEKAMSNLATWIEMVCLKSSKQGTMYADTEIEFVPDLPDGYSPSIQIQALIKTFQKIAGEFSRLSLDSELRPITHHHTECIFSSVRLIHSSPLPYPRFFFQSLQETKLKLSVSPHSRTTGIDQQPVTVKTSELLAVKVEGVIERTGVLTKQTREVSRVCIQLHTNIINKTMDVYRVDDKSLQAETSLEQTADVVNDFFSVQFLAPFPCGGLYTCSLQAILVDAEGNRWRTDVSHSITVKSYEAGAGNSGQTRAISRT